jgi:DNA polymerase
MQGRAVHLDFESRSTADLRKVGVYRYAETPTTGLWLLRYKFTGGNEVQRWNRGDPLPVDLIDHVASGGIVKAHNATFERIMWNVVFRRDHGVEPVIQIEQCDCTMVRALNCSLPGKLEDVARVLGARHQKDSAGVDNMQRMARPRRVEPDGTIVWWDEPERIERLGSYCDDDVLAEEAIDEMLPPLSDRERYIYCMDQRINDRGIRIDLHAVERADELVKFARKQINGDLTRLTNGRVTSYTKNADIVRWLNDLGIECSSFGKDVLKDIRRECKRQGHVLALQVVDKAKEAGKTSVNKLPAMMRSVGSDGRARGTLQYYGATNSGRWAGRLWQPHNLPRVDQDEELPSVRKIIDLLHSDMPVKDIHDLITHDIGPVIPWISRCLRAMLVADSGKVLMGADFSNIEGRVAAWLADETWKLAAFRAYDEGNGPDLYKLAYANSFGCRPDDVTKAQRQIGKVEELSLGFQGGVGAFMSMAETYGVEPADIAKTVMAATPAYRFDAMVMKHADASDTFGLPAHEWASLKLVVTGWRGAHPNIVQMWWDLQDAAIEAVANPGRMVYAPNGKVAYLMQQRHLWCYLSSGRTLAYFNARIEWVKRNGQNRRVVRCSGRDNKRGGAWSDNIQLYGGLQFENIVQGLARDALADALIRIDAAGDLPIALHVHDENVSEVEYANVNLTHFEQLMAAECSFMPCLPISVGAWVDRRYVK